MMGREERGEEGRKTTVRVVRRMGCRAVTTVSRMNVVSWPVNVRAMSAAACEPDWFGSAHLSKGLPSPLPSTFPQS